jgi:hypothetical protein
LHVLVVYLNVCIEFIIIIFMDARTMLIYKKSLLSFTGI